MAFSPDSRYIASFYQRTISVWDVVEIEARSKGEGAREPCTLNGVAEERIWLEPPTFRYHIYSPRPRRSIFESSDLCGVPLDWGYFRIAIFHDGRKVAAVCFDQVYVGDVQSGELMAVTSAVDGTEADLERIITATPDGGRSASRDHIVNTLVTRQDEGSAISRAWVSDYCLHFQQMSGEMLYGCRLPKELAPENDDQIAWKGHFVTIFGRRPGHFLILDVSKSLL